MTDEQTPALIDMLTEARDFIDRYSDVNDRSYGVPEPNDAMVMVHEINATLEQVASPASSSSVVHGDAGGVEREFLDAEAMAEAWSDRVEIQRMVETTSAVFAKWASPELLSRFRQQMMGVIQQAYIEGVAARVEALHPQPSGETREADFSTIEAWIKRALIYINQCVGAGEIHFPGIEDDPADLCVTGFELFGLGEECDPDAIPTASLIRPADNKIARAVTALEKIRLQSEDCLGIRMETITSIADQAILALLSPAPVASSDQPEQGGGMEVVAWRYRYPDWLVWEQVKPSPEAFEQGLIAEPLTPAEPAETRIRSLEAELAQANANGAAHWGRATAAEAQLTKAKEGLKRIAAATPGSTNSEYAGEAFSWTAAVANTALAAISTPAQASGEPVAWPEAWSGPCTVGNMIANLRTLPPEMPLYTAYHIPMDDGPSLLKVKRPTLSRERVDGTNIKTGDESIPYSAVIWTQPRDPAEAHPPAQASETGGEDSAFKVASDLHAAYEQLIYGLPKYLEAENLTDEENMIREAYITLDVTAHRLAALSAPQAAPGEGGQL